MQLNFKEHNKRILHLPISFFMFFFFISFFLSSQQVQTTIFSHPSGVYKNSFYLKNLSDNIIYYTINGKKPSRSSLTLRDSIFIKENTAIRAISYNDSLKRYVSYFSTYIISSRKFTLPIISIAIDSGKMFDSLTGLYMRGPHAELEPPYIGANFHKGTELPMDIEFIDTTGAIGFNQPAGLRIFGGNSRGNPQKSFAIISRSTYGKKGFDYPLFSDLPYQKYKSFLLRNSGSDFNHSHFRDVFMTQLVRDLSFPIQSYRTCIVFINGHYWGIYHIREKINEHFISQHYDVDKDSVSIMQHRFDLKMGSRHNYDNILTFLHTHSFSDTALIDSLNTLIDVNNYLEYTVSETYFENTDAGGNIRYWRTFRDTSRWRWIMFDTDFGFGLDGATAYKRNSIKGFTTKSNEKWPHPAWSTLLTRKLLENDSIRDRYINKYCYFIASIFDSNRVLKQVDDFVNLLDPEIDYHHKRWGSNRSRWNKEIKRIKEFSRYRSQYIYDHLEERFNLNEPYYITIKNPPLADVYYENYLLNGDLSGYFYGDIHHHLMVKPVKWYRLKKWQGISSTSNNVKFKLSKNTDIFPILEKKPKSSLVGKIRFSEINFKKQKGLSDWIEIMNLTDSLVNVSNWFLLKDGYKEFSLPDSCYILPNGYLVIAKESKTLDSIFSISSISGMFSLKDTSKIELYTHEGNLVDSITLKYTHDKHIELINIWDQGFDLSNWKALKTLTPGKVNKGIKEQIQFNFMMSYIIVPIVAFILLFSIIFALVKLIKRLRSSTE